MLSRSLLKTLSACRNYAMLADETFAFLATPAGTSCHAGLLRAVVFTSTGIAFQLW